MTDRRSRAFLASGLAFIVVGGAMMTSLVGSIRASLSAQSKISPAPSQLDPSDADVEEYVLQPTGLDSLMLQIELPRTAAEVSALAPARTRGWWRRAISWDYLFIIGYILVFWGLVFDGRRRATLWEHPAYCATVAASTDFVENGLLLRLLNYMDSGIEIAERRTFVALPIVSGAKWLLVFLCVRAVSIQMERHLQWRWIAVWLRATATGGSWAAILALLGMATRPILALMTGAAAFGLLVATSMRLFGVPPGETTDTLHETLARPPMRSAG